MVVLFFLGDQRTFGTKFAEYIVIVWLDSIYYKFRPKQGT